MAGAQDAEMALTAKLADSAQLDVIGTNDAVTMEIPEPPPELPLGGNNVKKEPESATVILPVASMYGIKRVPDTWISPYAEFMLSL